MNNSFENISEEKRNKILDACIEEFAINGYKGASTNTMVSKAEISKGLLFHYFGNKKTLYLYLFDYCMAVIMEKYNSMKDKEPGDIIQRLLWYSILKIKLTAEEPMKSRLIYSAVINMPIEAKEEITERYNSFYAKYVPEIFENLDISEFRKDIDVKKAMEMISIFIEGLTQKYMLKYKNKPIDDILNNMEDIIKEYNEYLDIMKYGMYSFEK